MHTQQLVVSMHLRIYFLVAHKASMCLCTSHSNSINIRPSCLLRRPREQLIHEDTHDLQHPADFTGKPSVTGKP